MKDTIETGNSITMKVEWEGDGGDTKTVSPVSNKQDVSMAPLCSFNARVRRPDCDRIGKSEIRAKALQDTQLS